MEDILEVTQALYRLTMAQLILKGKIIKKKYLDSTMSWTRGSKRMYIKNAVIWWKLFSRGTMLLS